MMNEENSTALATALLWLEVLSQALQGRWTQTAALKMAVAPIGPWLVIISALQPLKSAPLHQVCNSSHCQTLPHAQTPETFRKRYGMTSSL